MTTTERVLGVLAAILAIVVFVTGKQSFQQWRAAEQSPNPGATDAPLPMRTSDRFPPTKEATPAPPVTVTTMVSTRETGSRFVGAWDSEPIGLFRHYFHIARREDGRFELTGISLATSVPLDLLDGRLVGTWEEKGKGAKQFTLSSISDYELQYTFGSGTPSKWIKFEGMPSEETARQPPLARIEAIATSKGRFPIILLPDKRAASVTNDYLSTAIFGRAYAATEIQSVIDGPGLATVEYRVLSNRARHLRIEVGRCTLGVHYFCTTCRFAIDVDSGESTKECWDPWGYKVDPIFGTREK